MASQADLDFEAEAKLPLLWQTWARQHIVAANLVRNGHDAAKLAAPLHTSKMPILLSYGLAAENLIKGLLIAQGVIPVKPAKGKAGKTGALKLSEEIKTHDLKAMFKKARLTLTEEEKDVLKKLTWAVKTAKHPVGTRAFNPLTKTRPRCGLR